jgi:hypothetical protein
MQRLVIKERVPKYHYISDCRREKKLYTSIKVGHSGTSVLFTVWYGFTLSTVKTTLGDDL